MILSKRWFLIVVVALALSGLSNVDLPSAFAQETGTLIDNAALVITMDRKLGDGELGVIEGADILLRGDTISAISEELHPGSARVVDASGKIVMPGFVDLHNHLWQSLVRGCGADEDLNGWLAACVFPLFDIELSEAEAYAGVRLSTLDLITSGVTTVVDWSHSFSPEFVRGNVRALRDSGLRFVFAYFGTDSGPIIDDMKRVKKQLIDPYSRAAFQVASHPHIADKHLPNLVAMTALAKELGVKLHVHLLENIMQRQHAQFDALVQADALGPTLLAAHAIHLTNSEISTLARRDVRVAHSPLSNMRLGSGIIRLPDLVQGGVKVGLGLDGGTNDMFNAMRTAVGLQRITAQRSDVFPRVDDALRMATLGGAVALGIQDQVGSLSAGRKADLIIIDPGGVNFAPRFDWMSQLVFNGQPENVEWVFVDGHAVKRRGRLVSPDAASVVQAAGNAARDIKARLAAYFGTRETNY